MHANKGEQFGVFVSSSCCTRFKPEFICDSIENAVVCSGGFQQGPNKPGLVPPPTSRPWFNGFCATSSSLELGPAVVQKPLNHWGKPSGVACLRNWSQAVSLPYVCSSMRKPTGSDSPNAIRCSESSNVVTSETNRTKCSSAPSSLSRPIM